MDGFFRELDIPYLTVLIVHFAIRRSPFVVFVRSWMFVVRSSFIRRRSLLVIHPCVVPCVVYPWCLFRGGGWLDEEDTRRIDREP
jgi:hypothetical protein